MRSFLPLHAFLLPLLVHTAAGPLVAAPAAPLVEPVIPKRSAEPASNDGFLWIEGEAAAETDAQPHGWYDGVRADGLSGGARISNFQSPAPATARYQLTIPATAEYDFWVRANPIGARLSYRIDDGKWTPLDFRKAVQEVNLATDGKPDLRYMAWVPAGRISLTTGERSLEFRFESENGNHGAIDAFVLSKTPFLPNGMLKPGEKTGRAEPGKWAFEPAPDTLAPGALLDLRYLNEKPAGKSGFVKLSDDGESFVDGAGRPLRFWGGTTYVAGDGASLDEVRRWAEFHAKRGVNMVRFHGSLDGKGGNFQKIDQDQLDAAWKLVAGMKDSGIYTTISPYWGSHTKIPQGWDPDPKGNSMTAMLFFDPATQAAYKGWLRELFTTTNPYTGIALKDDPAFAIFQIQNEDSLLFWTEQDIQGEARQLLSRQFGEFLTKKYGSIAKTLTAWDGAAIDEDDPERGILGLYPIWQLTQDNHSLRVRVADQLEFYSRTMRNFNAMIASYVRDELKAPQLINAGNWRTADDLKMLDSERWSYNANEVSGVNSYVSSPHLGEASGWSIRPGDQFRSESALKNWRSLPTNIKQAAGHPMIISESLWVPPNLYQAEAPLAVAAYQSLTGVDAFYWFTIGRGFDTELGKWSANTPVQLGMFPSAALIFRNAYLAEGKPIVHEHRALDHLWNRSNSVIAEQPGFDPNRDASALPPEYPVRTGVDPMAFLIGPVKVTYDADPAATQISDPSPYIDSASSTVRSNTDQIKLDTQHGVLQVDAPKAQAAAGFLGVVSPIELTDVKITTENEYVAVTVVSLDTEELAKSHNILVQVATTFRPYGFRTKPSTIEADGKKVQAETITELGSPPLNLEKNQVVIELKNPSIAKAWALNANGEPTAELPLRRTSSGIAFDFPADALSVVLR